MKFGTDGRLLYLDIRPSMGVVGYSTDTVQDFLATGQADIYTNTNLPAKILAKALSLYAQDTWNVIASSRCPMACAGNLAPRLPRKGHDTRRLGEFE